MANLGTKPTTNGVASTRTTNVSLTRTCGTDHTVNQASYSMPSFGKFMSGPLHFPPEPKNSGSRPTRFNALGTQCRNFLQSLSDFPRRIYRTTVRRVLMEKIPGFVNLLGVAPSSIGAMKPQTACINVRGWKCRSRCTFGLLQSRPNAVSFIHVRY